jgi:hypothetical protein
MCAPGGPSVVTDGKLKPGKGFTGMGLEPQDAREMTVTYCGLKCIRRL